MERINWNEPRLNEEELEEVSKVIKESYVNEGPKTKELEEKLKEYLKVKYVIFTTSATAALFLAIRAESILRNKNDFEVIVPNLTMFGTASAIEWAGGKPRIVDVEKNRGTIDVEKIESKINEKTLGIVPVHILGRATNLNRLKEIAERHNLAIIEDAAGALGSKYNGEFLGTIGKAGCFSLQSNKIMTCGQGGIIITNDNKYYEIIRRLRDFGRLNNKEFLHNTIGFNLKFNDILSAVVMGQFKKLEDRKKLLREQFNKYKENLSKIKQISFFECKDEEIPLWVDIIVENREELIEFLKSQEIYPRACWPALNMNPPYKNQNNENEFSNSIYLSQNILWLPNGPAISNEHIDFICSKIKEFYNSPKFKKITEDERGYIYLVNNLLNEKREFTFMEIKKGFARGGCFHSCDENFVVIKGKLRYICGDMEKEVVKGDSEKIPAFTPHAFIALEDSIVSEWGVTTEEKEKDKKDEKLRNFVDKINQESKNKNYFNE